MAAEITAAAQAAQTRASAGELVSAALPSFRFRTCFTRDVLMS